MVNVKKEMASPCGFGEKVISGEDQSIDVKAIKTVLTCSVVCSFIAIVLCSFIAIVLFAVDFFTHGMSVLSTFYIVSFCFVVFLLIGYIKSIYEPEMATITARTRQ